MPKFSAVSRAKLDTCDPRLVRLFENIIANYDCSVEGGARTLEEQRANVAKGVSKTLDSKHVVTPEHPLSRAIDVAPYPVRWPAVGTSSYVHDVARFYVFAGVVKEVARLMALPLRWGGDWDSDGDYRDQLFDDLDHYELVED